MKRDNLERLMKSLENNAFPLRIQDGTVAVSSGLTKREYFAAMAMQGLITHGVLDFEDVADIATDVADQLIEELQKINCSIPVITKNN